MISKEKTPNAKNSNMMKNTKIPMMILKARLVPKDPERRKAFHSSLMKCLNIVDCLGFEISF